MSKWFVYAKKADFKKIESKYGIDQVVARIMRNRDVISDEQIEMYLNADMNQLHDPHQLKDVEKALGIITDKIHNNKKIRIIGDYDIDGICSITILYKALKKAGADVDYVVPDRIADGYGINEHLIDYALEDGIDTIITCDNGIAAISQIDYAKAKGLTVIVTDHHDIPFKEEEGEKILLSSNADAIVNPKQPDCAYPFKMLCGAGVAYKLVSLLYHENGMDTKDLEEYAEFAAIATIGDVVDLRDENRVIVKYGLKHIAHTKNIGLRALIDACQLEIEHLSAYHIGFIIGPCMNASGRLDTAAKAIELFLCQDRDKANHRAEELRDLNEERKEITEEQTELAIEQVEKSSLGHDNVLVVYLPDCHESVAGIIAGRLRERFYKPSLVITRGEDCAKGSGRSIEGYNMFEEISKCGDLLLKYGGHPMAAGFSLEESNIDAFRTQLNTNQRLTDKELTPSVWIDVPMPLSYVTMNLVSQLHVLEPFGKGNEKPVFADKGLTVSSARLLGKNQNVLKMQVEDQGGSIYDAVMFRVDVDSVPVPGQQIAVVYYPDINEYNGRRTLQFVVQEWCVCN
jgi:single-stranded-DNA-specific exonuclease